MVKIGESCFNILPPGALTPQGIEGAMKRDVSKHWCIQWFASRGWFIAVRIERHVVVRLFPTIYKDMV